MACYIGEVSRNPEVTPQSVIHQLGLAGPAAKGAAAASWEKIQQELLARGEAKGKEMARKSLSRTLLSLAERSFGRVKAEHKARIESATLEELDAWNLAVLRGEVKGLEELFGSD